MKLVSVAEMQSIEREADASGLTYAEMMENAGRGLAEAVESNYGILPNRRAAGLVGSGNNGGDTLVALAHLAEWGWETKAYLIVPRPTEDPLVERLEQAGGQVLSSEVDDPAAGYPNLKGILGETDVLLDGVLGTGIRLPLKPPVAGPLAVVNLILAGLDNPPLIVAVDCPSGTDLDSGETAPETLPADLTVTMAAVKNGLLKFPAFEKVGRLEVVGIGRLDNLKAWEKVRRTVVDEEFVRAVLPARPLDAHKGTFGTALVVAGSTNYTGAALLAGMAAYRVGAGLVTLAVPAPLHLVLAGHFPEATWLLLPHDLGVIAREASEVVVKNIDRATSLLVGPGFGLEKTTQDFLARLLGVHTTARSGKIGFVRVEEPQNAPGPGSLPPMIVDADGLKLLARIAEWPDRLPKPSILTPHPGEMSVLTGLSKDEIQADRIGVAERFAQEWGHVLVLKGAFTVIASPDGDSAVVPVATPALARAGTGDVLAGLIAGLCAQGLEAFPAAAAAAWIHAQAGLRAVETAGHTAAVLAGDVIFEVGPVLSDL